jgi:hypothetical protein
LDDEIPDHSVLSKARKRWGKEVFLSLSSRAVHQCVEAGLVGGSKIRVDASLVDANAPLKSVQLLTLCWRGNPKFEVKFDEAFGNSLTLNTRITLDLISQVDVPLILLNGIVHRKLRQLLDDQFMGTRF